MLVFLKMITVLKEVHKVKTLCIAKEVERKNYFGTGKIKNKK